MATAQGLARVAAINAAVGTKGYSVAPTSPTTGSNASGATSNPHDAPGYNPVADPTSTVYNPTAPKAPVAAPAAPVPPPTSPVNASSPIDTSGVPNDSNPDLASAVLGNGGALSSDQMSNPDTIQGLSAKYRQGLKNAQASGPAPATAGSLAAKDQLPPAPPKPQVNPIDQQLQNDPGYQQLIKDHQDYLSAVNQRDTLTQEYTKLNDSLGIPSLNTQLMNMKRVIDGTEDDIRSEVQAVSGFATNSQILALSSARNKVNIQNYNNLLETRNNAQTQLTTMIGLAKEDRAQADKVFNDQMQFDQQVMQYRDKFVTNAKEGYNNVIKAAGYKGLYSSLGGDPSSISLAERTLGLNSGQLAGLASLPPTPAEQLDQDLKTAQIAASKASTAASYASIGKTQAETAKITAEIPTAANALTPELSNNINQINTLLNDPQLGKITGLAAYNPLNLIPGSSVNATKNQLNQLKATISLDARQKLKGQGAISDFEFKVLGDASSALSKNLSLEDTKKELLKIKGIMTTASGQPTTVQVKDPKTGESKTGMLGSKDIQSAISQGYLIEYQ